LAALPVFHIQVMRQVTNILRIESCNCHAQNKYDQVSWLIHLTVCCFFRRLAIFRNSPQFGSIYSGWIFGGFSAVAIKNSVDPDIWRQLGGLSDCKHTVNM